MNYQHGDTEPLVLAAAKATGWAPDEILGRRKFVALTKVRAAIWYIARHGLGLSYPVIAYRFGMFDHTTVMCGVDRASKWMEQGSEDSGLVDRIVRAIGT